MHKAFICIAGNIGSGKTTVADLIAREFAIARFEESVEDNPYLPLFYADMNKWSYRLQRYFLMTRALMQEKINMSEHSAILDRSIYEDMEVFAKNQYLMRLWSDEEYAQYKRFCALLLGELRPPDLLIYLNASLPVLRERIARRGRDYERSLTLSSDSYLPALQDLYEQWFLSYNLSPKLKVNTDRLDFVGRKEHIERLFRAVSLCLEKKGDSLTKFL